MTSEMDDFFGAPAVGNGKFPWKYHTIKDGDNLFRIAPPVKGLKSQGRWSVYDVIHKGYTMPNEKNPDKPLFKTFKCIQRKNRATGMVEQDCPECTELEAIKTSLEQLKAEQIAKGRTPEEAEEMVKGAKRLSGERYAERKHYVLAKDAAGDWGILKLGLDTKKDLDKIIEEYMKQNGGEHPLAASSGVWFNINKSGKGQFGTSYKISIAQESLGGGRFQYKAGPLTSIDQEGIMKCPDLATVNDNLALTYDQIRALVTSKGDPVIVAQVFNQGVKVKSAPAAPVTAKTAVPDVAVVANNIGAAINAVVTPPVEDDEEAALLAQMAALKAKKAAAKAAPVEPPKAMANPDVLKMDPAAFLAAFPDPSKK